MSYTNFIKAMELAPKCKFYTTAGGKSEEEIKATRKQAIKVLEEKGYEKVRANT